jgi:hypothetical protein
MSGVSEEMGEPAPACGFRSIDLKVGERWLIDAYVDSAGRWIARQCSVTLPFDKAKAVLEKLKTRRP